MRVFGRVANCPVLAWTWRIMRKISLFLINVPGCLCPVTTNTDDLSGTPHVRSNT